LEIILNMVLLVVAGSETTANLLTGFTYLICTNHDVYQRLVAEIRGSFLSANDIKWETTKDLPYLTASINEALRLFSPAGGNQQRVVPPGGATIDGHYVPAGITVAVSPWAAGHSALNFCEANKFRPERWLSEHDEKFSKDKLQSSQPFSTGPKGCLGKNVSYFEARLILSHLLWNFDLELESKGEPGAQNRMWTTSGDTTSIKLFQALLTPKLWVRLKDVQR
jgi:cytochrome P450